MALPARLLLLTAALAVLALSAVSALAAGNVRVRLGPLTSSAARSDGPPGAREGRSSASPGWPFASAPAVAARVPPARAGARPSLANLAGEGSARERRSPRPPQLLARVRDGRSIVVRAGPGGRVIGRLGARTEFGSPQVLAGTASRGRWLGVASTARTDGRLGWVDRRSSALRVGPARASIRIGLSRRRIELRRGGRVLVRARVAVGRPGSATPTGRFAVIDKLDGRSLSPYYGCCVLALSGTQPNPPPGWSGGNRLAIHGTEDPSSIGQASSAGCLRAADGALRRLMASAPLGTPVTVRE